MAFGRLQTKQQPNTLSEMNITPMVDVMLVLLIIFMIAAPVITQSLRINLPAASGITVRPEPIIIHISINDQAQYFWNNQAISYQDLTAKFAEINSTQQQPELQLYADKATRYEMITDIMSIAQSYGVTNIAFMTSPTH